MADPVLWAPLSVFASLERFREFLEIRGREADGCPGGFSSVISSITHKHFDADELVADLQQRRPPG